MRRLWSLRLGLGRWYDCRQGENGVSAAEGGGEGEVDVERWKWRL